MRLTYLDILEQCFHDKWRGYDKKEVDTFLHLVAEDFKEINEELRQLHAQVDHQNQKIEQLESSGNGKSANINPDQLRIKAKRIIELARQEADKHLHEVDKELTQIKTEVEALRREKGKLIESIKINARTQFNGQPARTKTTNHETASNPM